MLDLIVVSIEVTCVVLAGLGVGRSIVKIKDDRERWELEQPDRAERELERSRAEGVRLQKLADVDERRLAIQREDDKRREELKYQLETSPAAALRKQIEALGKRRLEVCSELSNHRMNNRQLSVPSCEKELEHILGLSEQYVKQLIDIEKGQVTPDERLRAVRGPDDRSTAPVQQACGEDGVGDGTAAGDGTP